MTKEPDIKNLSQRWNKTENEQTAHAKAQAKHVALALIAFFGEQTSRQAETRFGFRM
ncbi:hypothetical protein D3C83_229440 [compost metagenome]